jgi:hypothetical protein
LPCLAFAHDVFQHPAKKGETDMVMASWKRNARWGSIVLAVVFFLLLSTQTALAKKEFKMTKVKIRKNASVSKYLKRGRAPKDLKELLKGIGNRKNWTIETKGEEVTAAYPTVNGHKGHVDGKDWKMYIERGKKTVDRLLLKKRKYKVVQSKKKPDQLNVEIYTSVFVEEDTHP